MKIKTKNPSFVRCLPLPCQPRFPGQFPCHAARSATPCGGRGLNKNQRLGFGVCGYTFSGLGFFLLGSRCKLVGFIRVLVANPSSCRPGPGGPPHAASLAVFFPAARLLYQTN